MKRQLITIACAAAFAVPLAVAQTAGTTNEARTTDSDLIVAEDLDGLEVKNMQDEELGEIERLLLDPRSGRVRYAVLEVDKAWSLNDPKVAVPWTAFNVSQVDGNVKVTLNATKEKLENSPKWSDKNMRELNTRSVGEPIYTYWAVYWMEDATSGRTGASTANAPADSSTPSPDVSSAEAGMGSVSGSTGAAGSASPSPTTATTPSTPGGNAAMNQP